VRPPGFWGPVAGSPAEAAADVRRLYRGLAATALGALAAFSVLVGAGTWLVGAPEPVWWPAGRGAWVAANGLLAVVLVPVCRRLVAWDGATPSSADADH